MCAMSYMHWYTQTRTDSQSVSKCIFSLAIVINKMQIYKHIIHTSVHAHYYVSILIMFVLTVIIAHDGTQNTEEIVRPILCVCAWGRACVIGLEQ